MNNGTRWVFLRKIKPPAEHPPITAPSWECSVHRHKFAGVIRCMFGPMRMMVMMASRPPPRRRIQSKTEMARVTHETFAGAADWLPTSCRTAHTHRQTLHTSELTFIPLTHNWLGFCLHLAGVENFYDDFTFAELWLTRICSVHMHPCVRSCRWCGAAIISHIISNANKMRQNCRHWFLNKIPRRDDNRKNDAKYAAVSLTVLGAGNFIVRQQKRAQFEFCQHEMQKLLFLSRLRFRNGGMRRTNREGSFHSNEWFACNASYDAFGSCVCMPCRDAVVLPWIAVPLQCIAEY